MEITRHAFYDGWFLTGGGPATWIHFRALNPLLVNVAVQKFLLTWGVEDDYFCAQHKVAQGEIS